MQEIHNILNEEEKIILCSLGAANNSPINTKTKLQKLIFLISNVFPDYKELIDFEAHHFGPYSEDIEVIVEDLIQIGLVEDERNQFFLTEKGKDAFSQLRPAEELMQVIEDFKEFLSDLTNDEILTFVYVTYPDYTEESKRWNQLQRKREEIAISLLKKQKISFDKAVEISGKSAKDFEDNLIQRKIKWRREPTQ